MKRSILSIFIAILCTIHIGFAQETAQVQDSIAAVSAKEKEAKTMQKKIDKAEKKTKKTEKAIKKAEKEAKKRKKLKKAIKSKENAIRKSERKMQKLKAKMEAGKSKGKLSPDDLIKLNKKIDKENASIIKGKQKLAKIERKQ